MMSQIEYQFLIGHLKLITDQLYLIWVFATDIKKLGLTDCLEKNGRSEKDFLFAFNFFKYLYLAMQQANMSF